MHSYWSWSSDICSIILHRLLYLSFFLRTPAPVDLEIGFSKGLKLDTRLHKVCTIEFSDRVSMFLLRFIAYLLRRTLESLIIAAVYVAIFNHRL